MVGFSGKIGNVPDNATEALISVSVEKKIRVHWGPIVFCFPGPGTQDLGRFGGNGYSKRLFALRRFWDW